VNVAIKQVWYPNLTLEHYNHCRIKSSFTSEDGDGKAGGYGGLFSLTLTSKAASQAFFDDLSCYKGPNLGTKSTLACPLMAILAHCTELEWAARYGVEEGFGEGYCGDGGEEGIAEGFGQCVGGW
jgi:cystathionine gamma-synthase